MSWTSPAFLALAAAAVALLPVAALAARWRRAQILRLATPRVWRRWLGGIPATGIARVAFLLVAAALAAIGAARPRWGSPGTTAAPALDVAVAIDVSASMQVADVAGGRIGRAVEVIRRVADLLPAARLALTVGAGEPVTVVPLTADRGALAGALTMPLPPAGMAEGSNLAALLAAAAGELAGGGGGRALLLVTDGEEHEGEAARVADGLRRTGASVVVLQCGSESGGPVPRTLPDGTTSYLRDADGALVHSRARRDTLVAVAGDAGAVVDAGVPDAASRLAVRLGAAARAAEAADRPEHTTPFLLAAALVATAGFAAWPWRREAALALVVLVSAAPAGAAAEPWSWARWLPGSWYVPAARGGRDLVRGDVEGARREFASALALAPELDALALGAASAGALGGDAAGLATLEARCRGTDGEFTACYNAGVAYLAQGDPARAAAALRRAVALRSADRDAWRNLEIALLRRQADERAGGERGTAPDSVMEDSMLAAAARRALQAATLDLGGRAAKVEKPW